jgi:hypothetical protein
VPSERTLKVEAVDHLIVGGWTGRNVEALEAHIRELEALGVRRPKSMPIFYRVAARLLTTDPVIQVLGGDSSGEVEYVLYALDDGLWLGLGSDHTDRKAETVGVALSKQLCAKPVGPLLWRYDEVKGHWDRLILRAHVRIGSERRLYQEGPVATMRHPDELIRLYTNGGALAAGSAMFGGTLAVHGGIVPADAFEMEIEDPVLGRKLTHSYRIETLPDEG